MNGLRCLAAVFIATSLAACGGGRHSDTGALARAPAPPPLVTPSALALVLPASAAGPTTCTVYEPGYATQVVFDSQSLNVTGECQAWTSRQPGAGYLWAYQPPGTARAVLAIPICDLRDPSGRVTASVVEETGGVPLSPVQRQAMASACTSLAAAGWVRHARAVP
jgi:hypothetical protein